MKLNPNNLKFKKFHKAPASNLYLKEQKLFFPLYGGFALKALAVGKLTLKQIEACRKSVRRSVKKEGRVWVRVFAYQSLTKKSLGSRMGKGKGNHSS
jgi:large subunit ribosomal protein L16